jgi:hypothetical protein
MADWPDDDEHHGEATGEQKLAAAVIKQALIDASGNTAERMRARFWLLHGTGVQFWSGVLGVNIHRLRTLAHKVLDEGERAANEDTRRLPPHDRAGRNADG